MKKMKKLVSALLASSLAISMSVPTFAIAPVAALTDKSIVGTGTNDAPVYSILLPTTMAIITNPLGLGGNPGLYTAPLTVGNKSTAAVAITAKVTIVSSKTQKAYGSVNQFDQTKTDNEFSARVLPVKNTATTVSAAVLPSASAPASINNYITGTNIWQLAADQSKALSTANYAVPKAGATPVVGTDAAEVSFLLNAASVTTLAYTAAADATNVNNYVGGFRIVGEVNPFSTWAVGDIKANLTFKLAGVPATVATAYRATTPTDLVADVLNVTSYKNATAIGALHDDSVPYAPTKAVDVALTATSPETKITLNKVPGTWTVDATKIKMLNTKTGDTDLAFVAADVTYTDTVGSNPAELVIIAGSLFTGVDGGSATGAFGKLTDEDNTAVGVAKANGTYDLSIPLVGPAGEKTTVFVTITAAGAAVGV